MAASNSSMFVVDVRYVFTIVNPFVCLIAINSKSFQVIFMNETLEDYALLLWEESVKFSG